MERQLTGLASAGPGECHGFLNQHGPSDLSFEDALLAKLVAAGCSTRSATMAVTIDAPRP